MNKETENKVKQTLKLMKALGIVEKAVSGKIGSKMAADKLIALLGKPSPYVVREMKNISSRKPTRSKA